MRSDVRMIFSADGCLLQSLRAQGRDCRKNKFLNESGNGANIVGISIRKEVKNR